MWTQIVGKIRMEFTPWTNHSWHVTLYLTSRGLTTSPIPHGTRTFEIRFDFLDHNLRILTSDDEQRSLKLEPRSVAEFYREVTGALREIGIPVQINLVPNEIQDPIPFDRDEEHRAYDAEYANRFWRVLVQADRIFKEFRADFCGKCSPVHFFWGSFDLAVTRFSGRPAPPHPGGIPHLPDAVTRESVFAGSEQSRLLARQRGQSQPDFYSYAYPEPAGFADAKINPASASYHKQLHEWTLPYDAVRSSSSPDDTLLQFAQSTYDAASTLAKWDRAALEEKKPILHSRGQIRN